MSRKSGHRVSEKDMRKMQESRARCGSIEPECALGPLCGKPNPSVRRLKGGGTRSRITPWLGSAPAPAFQGRGGEFCGPPVVQDRVPVIVGKIFVRSGYVRLTHIPSWAMVRPALLT